MKDGDRPGDQPEVSRQQLYDEYVHCYQRPCPEVRPCRDASLLRRAAQYLLRRDPEPGDTFTVFPFYQSVRLHFKSLITDCRTHLSAFIKATELLEIICVNLFLQPWRKEIRTLKTFTGPFTYCLLPVLSSPTIQSLLASIGYLPHTDTPPSEYRLSEDANPDRAMLLGFEVLLARVECYRLLETLEKEQLGPQEFLEVLQKRAGPTKLEEPTEKKSSTGQKEEENKKREEADRKAGSLHLDTRLAVKPQPKPRRSHLSGVDHSIMEMQMTYPDLAFRGRPLVPDKPLRASGKDVHTGSTHDSGDDSTAAELPKRDGSKADDVLGEDGRGGVSNGRSGGGSNTPGDSGAGELLSGPQAISLHIKLRAASKAENRPSAESPVWTGAGNSDLQNKKAAGPKLPSQSSMDEEQELRQLAERMGQLHVQKSSEEVKRTDKDTGDEDNAVKGKRKKDRKASTQGEAVEQDLKETGPALSHAARKGTASSQSHPGVVKEQKQPTACPPSPPAVPTVHHQGGGDEEQLTQNFVLV